MKPGEGGNFKPRKFVISTEMKYLLLLPFCQYDAHWPPGWKKEEHFSWVCDTLVSYLPSFLREKVQKPSVKSVRDQFCSFLSEGKEANRKNTNISCIEENVGPAEQPMDDLLLEREESETEKQRECNEMTARKELLTAMEVDSTECSHSSFNSPWWRHRQYSKHTKEMECERLCWWMEWIHLTISSTKFHAREKELELRSDELSLEREQLEGESLDRQNRHD